MNGRVSCDLTGWFGAFQRDVDALLGDMFQLCSAADEKRYSDNTVHKSGVMSVMIPNAKAIGETAPQRAARNGFIAAMSKFSSFLDRLIASQRMHNNGITIKRNLHGEPEILAYVKEVMEEAVAEVARDASLNVPKKLDYFPGVDQTIKDMVLSYNALRNALEHHHDLPKRDLKVTMRRIVPIAGHQEITEIPTLLPAGQSLGIRMIDVEKSFPANQKVLLEPQDGYDLLFTLRLIIAPPIFQWHVSTGKTGSASA
jgi:hypothetical protein